MYYLEKKEKVMVRITDWDGMSRTEERERWRGIEHSENREDLEALYNKKGPRARKQYRITEVNT